MKYGTVGTSIITNNFIEAAREQGSLTLVGVYSREEEKAKDFAKQNGAAYYYTDLEEMAKSDKLDCVYIASPNSLHFEQVKLFLEHKKHVICEKPIFSNLKELHAAYEVAKENDVFLFEAMRNLYMPGFQSLKENVEKVGKLRSAIWSYSKYSSRYNKVRNGEEPNIFSRKFSGGALVDLGVYPLSAAIALFGRPDQVSYSPVIIDTGVDGGGTLVLRYPEFICTILCSKITTTYNLSEIQGEDGTIIINDIGSFSEVKLKDIHTLEEEVIFENQSHHDMYYEIDQFVQIIQSDDQEKYQTIQTISQEVLRITEKVRKENGIIFGVE